MCSNGESAKETISKGPLDVSLNTALQISPCEPPSTCPQSAYQPEIIHTLFTWLNISTFKRKIYTNSIIVTSYTLNHMFSFRTFIKFRCCGKNFVLNKHKCFSFNWEMQYGFFCTDVNCLLDVLVLAKCPSFICPLLCTNSVEDDATESINKGHPMKTVLQRLEGYF